MKVNLGICALLTSVLAMGYIAVASTPVKAESIRFSCEKNRNGTPTTFAITSTGQREFIRWVEDRFTLAGYPPERRCQQVTNRINQYIVSGYPRYITHGILNNQPVVCVTDRTGGGCTGLLYTLKPGQDGQETVRQLLQLNKENFKNDPRIEGRSCRTYVEIKALLRGELKTAEVACKI
ncbi:COP23 domain-containing protein [Nostoc sphaeroides CHAB 2801]|uniref:COP23 domain-containing protein n=1 Tax=Nostoc sphaeroides TaxID=446679 RepID=UPI000E534987|nr:COP23 domain-containing protein [Nostoc sphaeroides]MCC5634067.1 COP23 domain-containing protein [Nostoc sphaeroides CHAB 2801]